MINNLKQGLCEDGNPTEINATDRADSLKLWSGREARIQHSIVNCALAQKVSNCFFYMMIQWFLLFLLYNKGFIMVVGL